MACDGLTEIADAIQRLVADVGLRTHLGEAGRAWAETHWSWDRTVGDYEHLYEQIVAEPVTS
jgi:glycosyltransferase involved in cell wall biosynthesis